MAISRILKGRIVEVTFHTVPSAAEVRELMDWVLQQAPLAGGSLGILATIEQGGLGTLAPDARKVFIDHWRRIGAVTAVAAVIIEGDGVAATLTRGFVRTLGTLLGRAWTVHPDRQSALDRLATRMKITGSFR